MLTLYFRILFVLFNENNAAYYLTMGPKKGRRVRKIEVPIDSVPEFELGHSGGYLVKKGGEGGQREGGGCKEGGGKSGGITLARGGSCTKRPRTERTNTETEATGAEE